MATADMEHIPVLRATTTSAATDVKCCCGHADCAFLKHNSSALDELEREVRTAARLGQVRTFSFFLVRTPRRILPTCDFPVFEGNECGQLHLLVGLRRSLVRSVTEE